MKPGNIGIKFLGLIVWTIWNVCPVYAQEQTDSVDRLIERSELRKDINFLLDQIQTTLQASTNVDPQKIKSLLKSLSQFSQSDELLTKIQDQFKSTFNMNDVEEILEWLESPLAVRITGLDNEMTTEKALTEMQQQMGKLYKNAQRVEMAQEIDAATQATEFSIITVEQMAIISGIMTTPEKSIETISSQMRTEINQYREQYKNMTILSILYAYQNLSDEELTQYIHFADSDVGQRYNKVVMDIVTGALEDISKLIHQELSVER